MLQALDWVIIHGIVMVLTKYGEKDFSDLYLAVVSRLSFDLGLTLKSISQDG